MHSRLANPLRCSAGVRVWDSPASLERLPATGKLGCLKKKEKKLYGGPGRDRTGDLFHAMEARSQLRHRPTPLIRGPQAHALVLWATGPRLTTGCTRGARAALFSRLRWS